LEIAKKKEDNKKVFSLVDYVKAMKKGNPEAGQELLGPGFHATHRVHTSVKTYNRKQKHKRGWGEYHIVAKVTTNDISSTISTSIF
jgi:hypothetical protein